MKTFQMSLPFMVLGYFQGFTVLFESRSMVSAPEEKVKTTKNPHNFPFTK